MEAALELIKCMPSSHLEQNLRRIASVQPDLIEDILGEVDQPLKVKHCSTTNQPFLACDYNRDGDSYRSPWSNAYEPPLPEGTLPTGPLRAVEVEANELFNSYREAYFEGGLSSVYFWDLDVGFACVVAIKKELAGSEAVWDSVHLVEVAPTAKQGVSRYRLTSTVMLCLGPSGLAVEGTLQRQREAELDVTPTQTDVVNIGTMVQEMENRLRASLETVYGAKAVEVTGNLRSRRPLASTAHDAALAAALQQRSRNQ
eukprot:TRINITY_DN1094_c0_g1_i1.p1 TRINITY_DN1094_c0_g1~~TRINITY_DN1094_c0_g1_i1.p1  ORF type:complete len:257 (+),score=36.25 TRINITY_DN1094_c0_g1_i1:54-824(+)